MILPLKSFLFWHDYFCLISIFLVGLQFCWSEMSYRREYSPNFRSKRPSKVFLNLQFDRNSNIRQFDEKFATVSHLSFLSQVHLSEGRGHNVTGKAKSLIVTAINITHQFVGLSIVPLKIKEKRLIIIDKYLRIVHETVLKLFLKLFLKVSPKLSMKLTRNCPLNCLLNCPI